MAPRETASPVTPALTRELREPARRRLESDVGRAAPAVTYAFLHADGAVSTFAAGRADAAAEAPIDAREPLPLYSMTKAITAVATLELLSRHGLALDADVRDLLPGFPFRQYRVSVADLLCHTSGLPNPFPLRWVHQPQDHAGFDESAARERACSRVRVKAPGARFTYSNLGYWWLGALVERLANRRFAEALADLGLPSTTDYPAQASALGHVRRFGSLRLAGQLLLEPWVLAGPCGSWMRIARHHVDGTAYGGLLGSAAELTPFLRRLVAIAQGAAGDAQRHALLEPHCLANGQSIPMTAALHVGHGFLFKEGGGAGFHSELRLYPERGAASVVIANSSEIDVKRLLAEVDASLL
jgi:D-alanyl-D-alanine carboxypeptidase